MRDYMPLTFPSSAGGPRRAAVNSVVIALVVVISCVVAMMMTGCGRPREAAQPTPTASPVAVAPAPSAPTPSGLPPAASPIAVETSAVDALLRAQAASLRAPDTAQHHPERTSPNVIPIFDAAAYARDPRPYLSVCEPGRVFATAEPGVDVPELLAAGPVRQFVAAGGSAILAVKAPPHAPVTFTTYGLGTFAHDLPSVTVPADAAGVAQVVWTATPGTVNNVHILVGSPLASGQVDLAVFVSAPASANAQK